MKRKEAPHIAARQISLVKFAVLMVSLQDQDQDKQIHWLHAYRITNACRTDLMATLAL
jgi:hypothetical protein